MPLLIHGDLLSQPTRAVYWFCLLNNIEVKFNFVSIPKQEHKSEAFLQKNPFGLIPVVEENGLTLFESQAILRYLQEKHKVADQWYPKELVQRARLNAYLDWHHTNTRLACAGYFRIAFLFPILFKMPKASDDKIKASLKTLHKTLRDLDTVWLNPSATVNCNGSGPFICGMSQPTIADLLCYSEMIQLAVLPKNEWEQQILPKYKNVCKFVQEMQKLPEYDQVHSSIAKIKGRFTESKM